MNENFQKTILQYTGAASSSHVETIQNLWSGYGKIERYKLEDSVHKSVVVKHVRLPKNDHHPCGWNTDISHQRKLKSYQVECEWYKTYSNKCKDQCRIPHCLALETEGDEVLMVLEDLDVVGFPARRTSVSIKEIEIYI